MFQKLQELNDSEPQCYLDNAFRTWHVKLFNFTPFRWAAGTVNPRDQNTGWPKARARKSDVLVVRPQDPYKCLYLWRSNKMNCNNIDTAGIGRFEHKSIVVQPPPSSLVGSPESWSAFRFRSPSNAPSGFINLSHKSSTKD